MSLNGIVNIFVQLGPCIGGLLYFGSADGASGTGQSSFSLIMLVRYISHHCVPVFKSSTFFQIFASLSSFTLSSHLCKSFFFYFLTRADFSKFGSSVTGVERSGTRLLSQLPYNFLQRVASYCMKGSLCQTFSQV